MKVLILSNMSPKKSAPLQGLFVDNQVEALKAKVNDLNYCQMRWNSDSFFCRIFKYPVFFIQFFYQVILKFKSYDIIHVHFYFPTIFLAYAYKLIRNRKVKIIVTCHGTDVYAYSPPSYLYRKLSKFVYYWIFTSVELQKKFYRDVEPAQVICAGYNEKHIFHINIKKEYDFMQVCSLDLNKGVDRFLNLVKAFPSKKFALVGEGNLKDTVIQACIENSNLVYLGKQSPKKLAVLLNKSKYLLSLSRNESFGLTITEAHACGVPAITTETDGSLAQVSSCERRVVQLNKSECQIIEKLKQTLQTYSEISDEEYSALSLLVMEQSKQFSLTEVSAQIADIYNKAMLD